MVDRFANTRADTAQRKRAYVQLLPLAICLLMLGCSNGRGSVENAQPPSSEQPPTTPPPAEPPPETPPANPPEQPPPSEPGLPPVEPPPPETPVNPTPPPPPVGAFNVGGTITGLRGSGFSLQLSGGQTLNNLFNGSFAFATPLSDGTAYTVTIAAQPTSPSQECVLENASGTVSGANVASISVTCTTRSFRVGGTVTGLAGSSGLALRNGTQTLTIASNGSFRFPPQPSASTYLVLVERQPENPWQECSVARGEGTVGSGDIQDIRVTCATRSYLLGGTVAGLQGGSIVLRNGSDTVEVQSDGVFTFPTPVASNGTYDVRVQRQPETPPQTCALDAPTGRVTNADVNSLVVRCSIRTFTVGGRVTGLAGENLVLQNNGADNLSISADGEFTFNTPIASGQTYNVSVLSSPTTPAQRCDITSPSGTVTTSNVTSVIVNCVRTEFTIGGTVTGLQGRSGLVLQNNGGNDLAIAADGGFTFTGSVPTGTAYSVSVLSQPSDPTQECVVTNASGAVNGDDVANISVSCTTSTFSVSGVVTGMGGLFPFVQIRNGPDILNVFSDGTYEFPTRVLSGATYEVTAGGGTTNCTVPSGTGTITNAPVLVEIRCGVP